MMQTKRNSSLTHQHQRLSAEIRHLTKGSRLPLFIKNCQYPQLRQLQKVLVVICLRIKPNKLRHRKIPFLICLSTMINDPPLVKKGKNWKCALNDGNYFEKKGGNINLWNYF